MKISIIILNTTGSNQIERLIDSILSQSYLNFEIIIIDLHDDKSKRINQNNYCSYISETIIVEDGLIYDSLNKAIDVSNGDLITIVCSEFFYYDENIFRNTIKTVNEPEVEICSLENVSDKDLVVESGGISLTKMNNSSFKKGVIPNLNNMFFKSELFEKYGKFNLGLPTAAFYELMLRFIFKHNLSVAFVVNNEPLEAFTKNKSSVFIDRQISKKTFKTCWLINNLELPLFIKLGYRFRSLNY